MVITLASIVGSSLGRVKPQIMLLVFAASPPSTQYCGVRVWLVRNQDNLVYNKEDIISLIVACPRPDKAVIVVVIIW